MAHSTINNLQIPIKPEIELLINCARVHLDSETAAQIQTLTSKEIDWEYLLEQANQHDVLPLLYKSLTAACSPIPPKVHEQLQQRVQFTIYRNFYLVHELLSILELLQKQQIPVIPFKGPILASSVYGDITLRTFCDLDLLIQTKDFFKVKDILSNSGYQQYITYLLTERHVISYFKHRGEYAFIKTESAIYSPSSHQSSSLDEQQLFNFSVDLHSRLLTGTLTGRLSDSDILCQNLQPLTLNGTTVSSLQPENLLLYLCIHGTKSHWAKLKWVCDVGELIRSHPQLEWEQIYATAEKLQIQTMLLLGLLLAHQLLDANLPADMLDRIQQHSNIQKLANKVYQKLYGIEQSWNREISFEKFMFHVRAAGSFQARLRYLYRFSGRYIISPSFVRVFEPTASDRLFVSLPRPLYFLYYLIRPIRVFRKFWLLTLKRE
jgi:hypothetical protein